MSDYDSEVRREKEINNQSQELLPCPFCGGPTIKEDGLGKMQHHAGCFLYHLSIWYVPKDLKQQWNTRHALTPPLSDLQKGGDVRMQEPVELPKHLTSPEQQRIANVLLGNVEEETLYGPVDTGEQQQPSRGDKCNCCGGEHTRSFTCPDEQPSLNDLAKAIERVERDLEESRNIVVDCAKEIESLRQSSRDDKALIEKLVKALKKNHDWHEQNDDYGGYPESDLCELNMKTLAHAKGYGKKG